MLSFLYKFTVSGEAQSQQATIQEKERAATERSLELNSRVASLESQVGNYRQEKFRIEAELEIEKAKSETLEEFKIRFESMMQFNYNIMPGH